MAEPQAYVHATTAAQVAQWLAGVDGAAYVAVDTETAGWDPYADRLLLVQACAGPDRPVLVLDATRVDPRALQTLLGDPGMLKVFHHGSFDLRFLAVAGVEVRRVADTMLAQQLLDGGEKTDAGVGLAGLAEFRLGMRLDKSVRETFGSPAPLTGEQLRYAADDAAATWGVFDQQWRELVGHGLTRVARLEFAALPVLADLALRGVAFDAPRWRALVGALEAQLPEVEQRVQAALVTDDSPRDLFGPEPVNLDSPEQVREALARTGVHVDGTREALLRDHTDHPAVAAFLHYRQVRKVTTSWGGDWAERVVHRVTGRVHADWRQIVGAGRIACNEPNLTQVPRDADYRACFGGQPGRALVIADYSQQELRILAAVSGDAALTEVFRRGGDLHATTAAMVFDVAEESVDAEQRAAAKQLNFGLMYGMGAPGFARATGMDVATAERTMARYFSAFPKVAAWLAEAEATAKRTGRARTPLGRVRALTGDGGPPPASLARNAPIQGAGADMTKLALAEVARRLRDRFGSRGPVAADGLVLVVHDELVADVPAGDAEEAAALVTDGMLAAAREVLGEVPAAVDAAVRPRWGTSESGAHEVTAR
ncbi:MAG TPA: DNA polymerase [Egibacteraceae bacterium]|nr:DNA polymerase [Egibacteraceae bacterium]